MAMLPLLIILLFVDVTTATVNCSTNVCSWYAWGPWGTCMGSGNVGNLGIQTQVRRACCPENLKVKTIEECIKECAAIHPGQLKITDANRNRSCTVPTTTTTTTTTQPTTTTTTTQPTTTKPTTQSTTTKTTTQPTTTTTASQPTTITTTQQTTTQQRKAQPTTTTSTQATTKTQATTTQQIHSLQTRATQTTSFTRGVTRRRTTLMTLHPSTSVKPTKATNKSEVTSSSAVVKKVQAHTTTNASGDSAVPAAVGATVGLLSLAGLSSCLWYVFWKRKKRNKEEKKVHPVTEESANGTPPAEHGI